jgi:hypothetical protein
LRVIVLKAAFVSPETFTNPATNSIQKKSEIHNKLGTHARSQVGVLDATFRAESVNVPYPGTDYYCSGAKGLQFPTLLACFLVRVLKAAFVSPETFTNPATNPRQVVTPGR